MEHIFCGWKCGSSAVLSIFLQKKWLHVGVLDSKTNRYRSSMGSALPEKALTTNVKVAGKRNGWSAPIDRRSSPAVFIKNQALNFCPLSTDCNNAVRVASLHDHNKTMPSHENKRAVKHYNRLNHYVTAFRKLTSSEIELGFKLSTKLDPRPNQTCGIESHTIVQNSLFA